MQKNHSGQTVAALVDLFKNGMLSISSGSFFSSSTSTKAPSASQPCPASD